MVGDDNTRALRHLNRPGGAHGGRGNREVICCYCLLLSKQANKKRKTKALKKRWRCLHSGREKYSRGQAVDNSRKSALISSTGACSL